MKLIVLIFYIFCLSTNATVTSERNKHFEKSLILHPNRDLSIESSLDDQEKAENFYGAPKLRDFEDEFDFNHMHYLLKSTALTHQEATNRCNLAFFGQLVQIRTKELADFIAEVLAETNLVNSSVWVSAKTVGGDTGTFYWYDRDKPMDEMSENVLKDAVYLKVEHGMDCMSIETTSGVLRFLPAPCSEKKPILCQRPHLPYALVSSGSRNIENLVQTHPGWIKVSSGYCRIYSGSVTWEEALEKCQAIQATLANPSTFSDCQTLSRFLKVGRPSLRQAWTGLKYESSDREYLFGNGTALNRVPDANNFPPWRNGIQRLNKGCLLLDRDTSVNSVFVTANCERKRGVICCRNESNLEQDYSVTWVDTDGGKKIDRTIDERGYRVYYQKRSWEGARDKCNSFKDKYGGGLAEPRGKVVVKHVLNLMGEQLKSIFHLWVGGRYDTSNRRWYWISDNSEISDEYELNWVKNDSFHETPESGNLCLNMDRVNGVEEEFYGTQCPWGQMFVCEFTREQLEKLQKDEAVKAANKKLRSKCAAKNLAFKSNITTIKSF